jgi:RND family efflux transporter MFP subunit
MNLLKRLLKILIPIVIILLAILVARTIIRTTKKPEKARPQRTAYSVEVIPLQAGQQPVNVQATGTVMPALDITLRARVAGEIVEVSPDFVDGGAFKKGDFILKIDPVDFQLALEQKKAALAEAEYLLQLEEGQSAIAAREWELLGSDADAAEDRDLALRVPHLKYRTAKLEAAKAELEKAELDLIRTSVSAPFNAVIAARKADLGTQVSLQDSLAMLAGSDQFYVRASIPMDQLRWIQCDPETGSIATITRNSGDVRQGRVVRMESAIEELGRMARVLITVDDPLQGENPMLLNEYVRVSIAGTAVEDAYQIPRSALHDDRLVWIATPDGTLEIREVTVNWRDAENVIISEGIKDGERLILTNLATPINGMQLRVAGDPEPEMKAEDGGNSGKGSKTNEK